MNIHVALEIIPNVSHLDILPHISIFPIWVTGINMNYSEVTRINYYHAPVLKHGNGKTLIMFPLKPPFIRTCPLLRLPEGVTPPATLQVLEARRLVESWQDLGGSE